MPNNPGGAIGQDNPLRKGLFSSLRAKMLLYFGLAIVGAFLLVSLVFTFGVPFTDYVGEFKAKKSEAFEKLEIVADQKKNHLERWIYERRGDAKVLAESEITADTVMAVRSALMEFKASGMEKHESWKKIREQESFRKLIQHLNLVKAAYGFYEEIDIADAETGEIFAATKDSELGRNVADQFFFIKPLQKPDTFVDFERDVLGQSDVDLFVSNVINGQGPSGQEARPLAVLIMRVDTGDAFKSMLYNGIGMGKTGEIMLVNQEAIIVAPLKYPLPDGTRAVPLEYQIKGKPAIRASQGKEEIIAANDYRGVPVLAVLRSLYISPGITLGMVVKQDRSEVLANLNKSISYFFLIFAVAIIALVVLTYWIASGLSRPIKELGRTVRLVESGDLSARAQSAGPYEVKFLVTVFNSMAQRLQGWNGELESRIQERTHELIMVNEELERQNKFLEAILYCVEDGIVACDNNAVLTLFNRATSEFHGLPQEPLPAEKWAEHYDLYLADGKTPMKMQEVPLFRTLKGDTVDKVEMVVAPKEGPPRTLLATGRALINSNGKSLGAVVSMHDITLRKRTEEKLKAYRENLEKIVEERTFELKVANEKLQEEIRERTRN
jgi:PAS domain S-box-containing protein